MLIKYIHMSLAVFSGCLFVVRGSWVLLGGTKVDWCKTIDRLSYGVDSCLLLAAILLLLILNYTPLSEAWLQAKLLLLALYIMFGVLAFRDTLCLVLRWLAYSAAIMCFFIMYYSARLHQPFAGLLG
ncbi:SirB2 family protein [Denitrificimonas sp. JX-1]|uniref:SirB2 family protein n=1 Tax=Denitrificimonas halotolerans TaxID=3098930 RepID=A0ABU5GRA3_9GAMM|nr:SirB2 family protein [Denitrificimonas sp. JX-1]MDY7219062.1 SirB2 family protein [Denitrificimonas sp. JX-1]